MYIYIYIYVYACLGVQGLGMLGLRVFVSSSELKAQLCCCLTEARASSTICIPPILQKKT